MKRFMGLLSISFIALTLLLSAPALAGDGDPFCVKFEPSIGIGYAHVPGKAKPIFRAHGNGMGGTDKTKHEYDYSGLYL